MKKFFSMVAIAAVAIAMVSCGGADPENTKKELESALKAQNAERCMAIADSINAMGESADVKDQAYAVVGYFAGMGAMDHQDANTPKEKQIENLKKAIAGIKNAVVIYDRIKAQDAEAVKAAFESLKGIEGMEDLQDMEKADKTISEIKENMGMLELMVTLAEKGGMGDGDDTGEDAEEAPAAE